MILTTLRGLAIASRAGDYVEHLRKETIPQLRRIAGFVDVSILALTPTPASNSLVLTRWKSLSAIENSPADAVAAVVPPEVQAMMIEYDSDGAPLRRRRVYLDPQRRRPAARRGARPRWSR